MAVFGAGAMGSGIAQVAAQAGHRVMVFDTSEETLVRSRDHLGSTFDKLVSRGKRTRADAQSVLARITWSTDLQQAAEARLVIEAIVENAEAKRGLFARLSEIVASDAILASNTSSLSIDDLSPGVSEATRFLGLHFFNPVPLMKLVEVVPGSHTAPQVVDSCCELMKQWGKVAAVVRDVPGFIVNRVARPYYAEAFRAWDEGITPHKIDSLLESAGNFRMGPLTLADFIGQDINFNAARNVADAGADKKRFRLQVKQEELVLGGNLGRKTGQGVFTYPAERPEPDFAEAANEISTPIQVAKRLRILEPLRKALERAEISLVATDDLADDSIRVNGFVVAASDGRKLASRDGVDAIFDHTRDWDAARLIGVTARNPEVAGVLAALLAPLEKRVIMLPDRPGQVVLRTLAQLANSAADAVEDDVASAADIDKAMRYGANHPEGPLEWAERVGREWLRDVLQNITSAEADALYTPSPRWSRAN
ncbi:3-hydroxyacyl-CoA dehydrogenase NAD-binding domain-containing protein [Aurantiacibacter sediminis]|uniref:3-hydroxyacyl-CoA dehydrogenase NAD-binding domain-containing protein n=1 Tax=Aurantiacibacter sediminis TaxID=2793064 RepID=UPI002D7E1A20|nr:3-hydroxyacyl-CoA dehydrogenase NAD-binding domain-containing protein [Aurantiacibacter sediminis]